MESVENPAPEFCWHDGAWPWPRDVLQSSERPVVPMGTSCRVMPVIDVRYSCVSLSACWAVAIAEKSIPSSVGPIALREQRDRASAMTLAFPEMCLMSVVHSEIAVKWRCWPADHGSEILASANVSGLCSVKAAKTCPSRKYLKCRIAR